MNDGNRNIHKSDSANKGNKNIYKADKNELAPDVKPQPILPNIVPEQTGSTPPDAPQNNSNHEQTATSETPFEEVLLTEAQADKGANANSETLENIDISFDENSEDENSIAATKPKKPLWQRLIFPVVTVAILVVYLFNANNIVMQLIPEEHRIFSSVLPAAPEKYTQTFGGVDEIIYSGGLTENLTVTGWCFSDTKKESPDAKTEIYLVSKNKVFIVPISTKSRRQDIYNSFKKKYSIASMDVAYSATFSTYNLPEATYDLYLYSWENEAANGLYKTGHSIVKTKKDIVKNATSIVDNFTKTKPTDDIALGIDSFKKDENSYALSGWCYFKGKKSSEVDFYMEISPLGTQNVKKTTSSVFTSSKYNLKPILGKDVEKEDYEAYLNSGFRCVIPKDQLAFGAISLKVIAKTKDGIYSSDAVREFILHPDGRVETITMAKTPYDSALAEALAAPPQAEVGTLNSKIDFSQIYIKDNLLMVNGTVFLPQNDEFEKAAPENIFIVQQSDKNKALWFGGFVYDASDEEMGLANFCAKIPANTAEKEVVWQIYVQTNDKVFKTEFEYSLEYNGNTPVLSTIDT